MKQLSIILSFCIGNYSFAQTFTRTSEEFNSLFSPFFEEHFSSSDLSLPDTLKDGYYKFYDHNKRIIAECLVRNNSLFKKVSNPKSKIFPEYNTYLKSIIYRYTSKLDSLNGNYGSDQILYLDTTNTRFILTFQPNNNFWQKSDIVRDCASYTNGAFDSRISINCTILKDVNEGLYWKQTEEDFDSGHKIYQAIYYWGHSYNTQHNDYWRKPIDNVYVGFNIFTTWDTLGNILTQTCNDSTRKFYQIEKVYDKGKLTTVYKSKYLKRKKVFLEYTYINNKLVCKDLYEANKYCIGKKSSIYHKDYN